MGEVYYRIGYKQLMEGITDKGNKVYVCHSFLLLFLYYFKEKTSAMCVKYVLGGWYNMERLYKDVDKIKRNTAYLSFLYILYFSLCFRI